MNKTYDRHFTVGWAMLAILTNGVRRAAKEFNVNLTINPPYFKFAVLQDINITADGSGIDKFIDYMKQWEINTDETDD